MHKVYIGLGSNLAKPSLQIKTAIKALRFLAINHDLLCSAIYQSPPMGDAKQPDYLNAVVVITTEKSAFELLDALQNIENQQGRKRTKGNWDARTIDLDLLLFDDQIINHPRLTVPHYGLSQRNFVIYPLLDIAPDLILPDGTSIQQLYETCSSDGIYKIDLF